MVAPRSTASVAASPPSNSNTTRTPTSSSSARRQPKKPYKSWLKDGVNGGPSSMQIVVQWLSANYATKWRDDSDNRMPKKLLLQEILDQMQQAGIHHRLPKDVASKISTLQSNYRVAREWYDVIGSQWRKAGAQETDVKSKLHTRTHGVARRLTMGTRRRIEFGLCRVCLAEHDWANRLFLPFS